MKLLSFTSFHYMVYVGLAILIVTSNLVQPSIPADCLAIERVGEIEKETVLSKSLITVRNSEPVLHSELLLRY